MPEEQRIGSILLADCGSVTTKAVLLDRVAGALFLPPPCIARERIAAVNDWLLRVTAGLQGVKALALVARIGPPSVEEAQEGRGGHVPRGIGVGGVRTDEDWRRLKGRIQRLLPGSRCWPGVPWGVLVSALCLEDPPAI